MPDREPQLDYLGDFLAWQLRQRLAQLPGPPRRSTRAQAVRHVEHSNLQRLLYLLARGQNRVSQGVVDRWERELVAECSRIVAQAETLQDDAPFYMAHASGEVLGKDL